MPRECCIVEITAMKVPNFVAIGKLNLLLQPTIWQGPHILEYLIQHDYLAEELYLNLIERITRKMNINHPEKKTFAWFLVPIIL
jgi:hypothetical protein